MLDLFLDDPDNLRGGTGLREALGADEATRDKYLLFYILVVIYKSHTRE